MRRKKTLEEIAEAVLPLLKKTKPNENKYHENDKTKRRIYRRFAW